VEVDDLWSAARKDSVDGAERTGRSMSLDIGRRDV